MKKIFFFIAVIFSFVVFAPVGVSAQSVKFPIPELGYCEDVMSCFRYCQEPVNTPTCWSYHTYVLHQNVLGDETVSPEEKAKKLGITFPIPELGNCTSTTECRTYCSDETHIVACSEFAAKHGLNKETTNDNGPNLQILQAAKTELGCATASECKALCQLSENATKCADFGEKHSLIKKRPQIASIINQARTQLGCTSESTCREMCALPQNSERCATFGEKVGLIKTEVVEKIKEEKAKQDTLLEAAKTDLGCTTASECRSFCQLPENKDACRSMIEKTKKAQEEKKKEAEDTSLKEKIVESGCTTDAECRKACELNPDSCPDFPKKAEPTRELELEPSQKAEPSRKPTFPQTGANTSATNAKNRDEELRKNSNSGSNDKPKTPTPTKNDSDGQTGGSGPK